MWVNKKAQVTHNTKTKTIPPLGLFSTQRLWVNYRTVTFDHLVFFGVSATQIYFFGLGSLKIPHVTLLPVIFYCSNFSEKKIWLCCLCLDVSYLESLKLNSTNSDEEVKSRFKSCKMRTFGLVMSLWRQSEQISSPAATRERENNFPTSLRLLSVWASQQDEWL